MRIWIITGFFAVAGAVGGAWGTRAEFKGVAERFVANNGENHYEERIGAIAEEMSQTLTPTDGAKLVVVNGEVHKFGVMEHNSKLSHEFLVKNEGTSPLRIESGGTSCPACTVSELPKNVIEPGETVPIKVEWKSTTPDFDYRKEAYIKTSDPKRRVLLLVVQGQVLQSLRVQPEDVTIDNIPASEGATRRFYVVVTKERPLNIKGYEFKLGDNAEYFDVKYRPATVEELRQHQAAKLGYAVDLTVKPGLPLGAVRQTLKIFTDWPEMDEVSVTIQGTVTSDISLLGGKNFEPKNNLVKIGVVKQGTEAKVTIPLLVRGPLRNEVQFKVGEIDPPGTLKVDIGEPKSINEGAVVMRVVTITVPADCPPVSRFGGVDLSDYGKIVLETTHPDAKQVQMIVRFAVQNKAEN